MFIMDSQIRGKLLQGQPSNIVKCGLSLAKFAKHCNTNQWYEISTVGQVIGTSINFDFYREADGPDSSVTSESKKKTLATV
jgi:hypothetical protein